MRRGTLHGLEAEADTIAAQLVHGRPGRVHLRATPSSYRTRTPGQALPAELQHRFELALGADLSKVRVHCTGADAAFAVAQGARAFAAGTSLVFAPGQFDPHTPRGRERIAHEVAHVVQQCGERDAHGRWNLQPRHGSGAVQCDPNPLPTSSTVPSLQKIYEHYWNRAGTTGRAEIDTFATEIGPGVSPILTPKLTDYTGVGLSHAARTAAERGFGHDFGDVRVHRGAPIDRTLRAAGASALTSGSHVLLRGDVDPSRGSGRHVLHHELAHVLQQTGPRPLGRGSPSPGLGHAGRGLRWAPGREAAADAMAGASLRRHADARPLPVAATDRSWAPSPTVDFGQRVLEKLTTFNEISERADAEEDGAHGVQAPIPRALSDTVEHVPTRLKTLLSADSIEAERPFAEAATKTAIATHLLGSVRQKAIRDAVPELAQNAERTKVKDNDVEHWVDLGDFKTQLERFIYGESGILLEIEIRGQGSGAARRIQAPDPVGKVRVHWVHLGDLHGGTDLWKLVLDNTYTAAQPKDDRAKARQWARVLIQQRGPSLFIFQGAHFQFRASFTRAVEAAIASAGGEVLDPGSLPRASAYRNTDAPAQATRLGNVGLRLGTYAERQGGGRLDAPDREAHHITQYLLIQYFHNGHESEKEKDPKRRAFKADPGALGSVALDDIYPGLALAGGRPGTFDGIEIAPLAAGRGALMPAISLARETHRGGGLHVTPSSADRDNGNNTQASVVNDVFLDNIGEDFKAAEETAQEDGKPDALVKAVKKHGKSRRTAAFKGAMLATYKWMAGRMQPALRKALLGSEQRYYERLAKEGGHPNWKLKTIDLEKVAASAIELNNGTARKGVNGLAKWKWVLP